MCVCVEVQYGRINRSVSGLHVATSFPGPFPWLVDASQLFKLLGEKNLTQSQQQIQRATVPLLQNNFHSVSLGSWYLGALQFEEAKGCRQDACGNLQIL